MTPPQSLFHSLLRPSILQILRATGYHSAKTSVLDSLTDLAARYFFHLCQLTALYASHNGSTSNAPTIVDVRMALQRVGALLPERAEEEQMFLGVEDMRGVEEFLSWAVGQQMREIRRVALDGNDEAGDYLDALKQKHSKNEDDTKFMGTLLGKCIEHGDVQVEGGEFPSILNWEERLRMAAERQDAERRDVEMNGDGPDSRPQSSGLSSLGELDELEMDLS